MASIHGIYIKNKKNFKGHDGEPLCQADIYLGKTKIAWWTQDSHGGPDDFWFEDGFSENKLNKLIAKLNAEKTIRGTSVSGTKYTIEYTLEYLLTDLLILIDDEKEYKKAVKAGFPMIMTITDGYHWNMIRLRGKYLFMSDDELKAALNDDIEKAKNNIFRNEEAKIRIYRSLDDFNIGKAIALDEIRR